MDQIALVGGDGLAAEARMLTAELDKSEHRPVAVMWVEPAETGRGRLWIVPSGETDKREFYVNIATTMSKLNLRQLNSWDVEMIDVDRARRSGLASLAPVQNIDTVLVGQSFRNGVALPQGIVFRMEIPPEQHSED